MMKLNKKKEIEEERKWRASKSAFDEIGSVDTNNSKTKSEKATNTQQQGRKRATKKATRAMKKEKSKSKFIKNNKGCSISIIFLIFFFKFSKLLTCLVSVHISAEEEEDLIAQETSKQPDNLLSQNYSFEVFSDDDDFDDEDFWDPAKYDQTIVESSAAFSRANEYYGSEHDERTCIWSGGAFKWSEKTSGIPWVGVNGNDATIVVAMSTEGKTHPGWTQLPAVVYCLVPLCDMGVWADTTTAFTEFRRKLIALNSSKENVGPFALVSIPPGSTEDHQEITNRDRAVEFLEKKLKGRSALIYEEVKQIAVCALKLLMGLKFDSSMVEQRVSGNAKGARSGVRISAVEVEEQLAAIDQT